MNFFDIYIVQGTKDIRPYKLKTIYIIMFIHIIFTVSERSVFKVYIFLEDERMKKLMIL